MGIVPNSPFEFFVSHRILSFVRSRGIAAVWPIHHIIIDIAHHVGSLLVADNRGQLTRVLEPTK